MFILNLSTKPVVPQIYHTIHEATRKRNCILLLCTVHSIPAADHPLHRVSLVALLGKKKHSEAGSEALQR